jgi:hypothetical protein
VWLRGPIRDANEKLGNRRTPGVVDQLPPFSWGTPGGKRILSKSLIGSTYRERGEEEYTFGDGPFVPQGRWLLREYLLLLFSEMRTRKQQEVIPLNEPLCPAAANASTRGSGSSARSATADNDDGADKLAGKGLSIWRGTAHEVRTFYISAPFAPTTC